MLSSFNINNQQYAINKESSEISAYITSLLNSLNSSIEHSGAWESVTEVQETVNRIRTLVKQNKGKVADNLMEGVKDAWTRAVELESVFVEAKKRHDTEQENSLKYIARIQVLLGKLYGELETPKKSLNNKPSQ